MVVHTNSDIVYNISMRNAKKLKLTAGIPGEN